MLKRLARTLWAARPYLDPSVDQAVGVIAEVAMPASSKPAVESLGIVKGHYECHSLDESLPVLSELLALETVDRRDKEATMKHPNTDWLLVVHESGPDVEDKPFRNHYGVRVTNNQEVDRAYGYLMRQERSISLKESRHAQ